MISPRFIHPESHEEQDNSPEMRLANLKQQLELLGHDPVIDVDKKKTLYDEMVRVLDEEVKTSEEERERVKLSTKELFGDSLLTEAEFQAKKDKRFQV